MDRNNVILLGLVGVGAAAAGVGAGSLIWRETPTAQSPEQGEHAGEHDAEEGSEPGFVALPPRTASAAGVAVATVGRGGSAELLIPGRAAFAPNAEASVGAPIAGVVERVHVAAGTRVGPGAPLVTIRSADGASMRAAVDAARAEVEAAQAAFRRETRLYQERVTARQDWEAARATSLKAEANLRAAEAQVAVVGSPGSGGRTTIRSPMGGTVTAVVATPGAVLSQGAAVAQVADQSRVELIFDAPASASRAIGVGSAIDATMAGGEAVRAIVTAVSPNPSTAGAQVRARAVGFVPPAGTPVSGRVMTGLASTLVVPSNAVQTVNGRPVVFVVVDQGFRAVPVVPGRVAAGNTEILSGLTGGERIAGKGAFLLKAELSKGEAEHEH